MQTILGNPLASPYTLGFSAAAGFGAALAIITGFTLPFVPWLTIPVAAFVAASAASALVYGFARLKGMSAEVMVLAGIATLFLFQSLQSMVQYLAAPEVLQAIVFWLFGSLLKASWSNLPITATIVIGCILALIPDLWRLTESKSFYAGGTAYSRCGSVCRHHWLCWSCCTTHRTYAGRRRSAYPYANGCYCRSVCNDRCFYSF